jgi:hypothetical protein
LESNNNRVTNPEGMGHSYDIEVYGKDNTLNGNVYGTIYIGK